MYPPEMSEEQAAAGRAGGHSGQWGLSSILLAGGVLILFPMLVALLFATLILCGDQQIESRHFDFGIIAFKVGVWGLITVSAIALASAITGFFSGIFRGQPLGLSVGGLVVSFLAVAASIIFLIICNYAEEWVRQFQQAQLGRPMRF